MTERQQKVTDRNDARSGRVDLPRMEMIGYYDVKNNWGGIINDSPPALAQLNNLNS
jgi:hypothetical protein